MGENLARKLIADHLVDGDMEPGGEIALRVDQILTHDGTGPLCALELEAMGITGPCVQSAVAYVDHLLVESDSKNADDHVLLESAAQRFGWWFSRAGNGVSHPVHQQRFGVPGAFLLGTDSHTPAAGALGMLAIGAGGLAVALALAGEPFWVTMPEIWGVRLVGELPDWVSAKDVILKMLRRHGVDGATGRIIEYHGPGVAALSAMDRHVIANMGTELGATTTVFPSDAEIRRYLTDQHRSTDWRPMVADPDADYEYIDEIDLGALVPLIALPSSLGNVVAVHEVAGAPIYQSYVGSSANFPGRSGAREDQVYLCSPETAAASALAGVITDPRTLDMPYPRIIEPPAPPLDHDLLRPPPPRNAPRAELVKCPGHVELPDFEPIGDSMELPVLLVAGNDVTTDEIMPAGARAMSLWSNLPQMSEHVFGPLDESYVDRARRTADTGGHAVVGGRNYGQGSSREQAALAPRFLGLRLVLAGSIARIHAENLVNCGILPLTFVDPHDREHLDRGTTLRLRGLHQALRSHTAELDVEYDAGTFRARYALSPRQIDVLLAGGTIPWIGHGGHRQRAER